MPKINIEGTVVSFPDSMNEQELQVAARKAYSQLKGNGAGKEQLNPTMGRSMYDKFGKWLPAAGAGVGGTVGGIGGTVFGLGVGGVPGGIGGAGLGGGAGEAARQLWARSVGAKSPETSGEAIGGIGTEAALGAGTQALTLGAGAALKPLARPVVRAVRGAGKTGARFVEAVTGVKVPDVMQAARQGLKTYLAPSLGKAEMIFGKALEKSGISPKPPLKQIIDPQLSVARKIALKVGSKIEGKLGVTAEEALRAKQATDRIIDATPLKDRSTRRALFELRDSFTKALSSQSGDLSSASNIYRKAIVKSKLLNPIRITKQGQMSAVSPLLASTVGAGIGYGGEDTGRGVGAGLATLGATSPLLWGAGITGAADVARLATSPLARKTFAQVLARQILKKLNDDKKPKQRQGVRQ
jgi:hypothetical protein